MFGPSRVPVRSSCRNGLQRSWEGTDDDLPCYANPTDLVVLLAACNKGSCGEPGRIRSCDQRIRSWEPRVTARDVS